MTAAKTDDHSIVPRPTLSGAVSHLCVILTATVLLRLVLTVAGGGGFVGSTVGWITEPFVYAFNRPLGLGAVAVGPGRVELGTILAAVFYAGVGVAVWFVQARGDKVRAWFDKRFNVAKKGGGK